MAGTFVRDALAVDLAEGADLDADGTEYGDVWDAQYPGYFGVELNTGDVGGTTPGLDVELQASNDSTFTTDVVSLGRLGVVDATDNAVYRTQFYTNKRYVRAVFTVSSGNADGDFSDATLKVVPRWDRYTAATTAGKV